MVKYRKYNVTFKCGHKEEITLRGTHNECEEEFKWLQQRCNCSKCRIKAYRRGRLLFKDCFMGDNCDEKTVEQLIRENIDLEMTWTNYLWNKNNGLMAQICDKKDALP